jgi:shikimate dehydrogenase
VTDRYAVAGNPIAHSKSPFIHTEFARQTGQDIRYERLLAPLDGFRATVENFRAEGGMGLNVTLPFKLEAYELAHERSDRAADAQAVNTLKFDGSTLYGDNTDGVGLLRDIEHNLRFPMQGRSILLMGAGGAAQGVIGPLLSVRPERIVIANRTIEKALRLAERFAERGPISASSYAALAGQRFDIVINATAASLGGSVPDLPEGIFTRDALAYDMMYGKGTAPFFDLARIQGAAHLADGIGMLVEQAAESFFIWRGVRPQTRPVIAALQAQ